jgi:hypothetical protein
MKPSAFTLIGVVGIAALVGTWDVFLLNDDEPSNTISSVVQSQGWMIGLVGYAAVHVARRPSQKAVISGWLGVIAGAVIAAGSSAVVGGGLIGLGLGAGTGILSWSNDGKS